MAHDDYAYFTDQEWNESPRQRSERLKAEKLAKQRPAAPKGTCPKCGTHIGRGVHFHMKACKA